MNLFDIFAVAFKSLLLQKVRAGLSMLGIVFGVAAVVAVVAVADGGKREVTRLLKALGAANIIVRAQNFEHDHAKREQVRKRSRGLLLEEVRVLGRTCPLFSSYAPVKSLRAYGLPVNVRAGERLVTEPEVVGTTPEYLEVMGFSLKEGRFLSADDEKHARRVCVLEDEVSRELWPAQAAAGKTLFVDSEPYSVIGVMLRKHTGERKYEPAAEPGESRESEVDKLWQRLVAEGRLNRRVYIPLSGALARTTQSRLGSEIDEAIFRARSVDDLPPAKDVIIRFLAAAHRMEEFSPEDRDFTVEVAMDLIRQTQENQRIFNGVIGATAGISLLVGGIGIMNIMLANVTERRREIGIRRAVGATQMDILKQFLFEALAICLVGGVVGVLVGVGMSYVVSWLAGYRTAIALWGILSALVVSLADGLLFGTYPAYKAGKLDPIEALRYE